MSIFSTETIKASKGKTVYKPKNYARRIAQESTYVYNNIDTDSTDIIGTIDNIMNQLVSLKHNQENVLRVARLKCMNKEISDLIPKSRQVLTFIEHMSDDTSIEIPNAREYHNIETRSIGFHSIFVELRNEINNISELMLVLKNISMNYKVPESEIIIKKMLEDRPNHKEFNVDFINYFSSPVKEVTKDMMIKYVKDFQFMTNNYYNFIKNSFDMTYDYLDGLYESLFNIKSNKCKINDEVFNNPDIKALVKNKIEYISNMYTNAVKYLHTYQISLEQRFDLDITAVKMIYDSMTGKISADALEDNTLDDDIEYGRFLAEVAIINEAEEGKVTTYLVKIANGIRIAWNKLNQKLSDGRKKLVDKFSDKLDELDANFDKTDPKFTITNYPNYDFTRLDNIKVVPFNYEEMKESLKSENDFIKKYYSNIPHNDKSNFKDDITNFVLLSRQDVRVTADTLHNMMKFVREDYDNHRKTVQTDIETVNKSNENINNIAKNINNQNQQQNSIKVDTNTNTNNAPAAATNVNTKESTILTEDDAPKTELKDDPDRKAAAGDQSFTKDISVYMKVSSAIISTKMKILKDHFMLSINTIIHAATPPKKSEEEKKEEKANNEEKK